MLLVKQVGLLSMLHGRSRDLYHDAMKIEVAPIWKGDMSNNYRMCRLSAVLVIASSLMSASAGEPLEIRAGPLTMEIHVAATAHVFHIVDQLAAWSPYCHKQYRDYFQNLSNEDLALLEEHARVRQERPWGEGLEQTFYTDLALEEALHAGVAASHLTQEQADIERRVLTHFSERAAALMKQEEPTLTRFVEKLRENREKIAGFSAKAARLCGTKDLRVPVYLIANPDDYSTGGGYNGGRLTLEIPRASDAINTFLHEAMHVFTREQMALLEQAAQSCPGLDVETLNEGIAYALSPGLLHNQPPGADPLAERVASGITEKRSLSDSYTRFNRYGLALRPLLESALEDNTCTLNDFLPRAVEAWRVTVELSKSILGDSPRTKWLGKKVRSRTLFAMAPASCNLYEALQPKWQANMWGRPHSKENYDELFDLHAKPGDVLVMFFALDQPERILPEYEHLLPRPWSEVEDRLKKGELVLLRGTAADLHTILLAAPTASGLAQLVDQLGTSIDGS